MRILSCESVMSGAFFPQPYPKMPQKVVSEYAGQDVVVPRRVLSHLVVIHPDLSFGLLKALLNCPPNAAQPYKGRKPRAQRRVADEKPVLFLIKCALHNEPNRTGGKPLFAKRHSSSGELVSDGSFGSFGDGSGKPESIRDLSGKRIKPNGLFLLLGNDFLRAGLPPEPVGLCLDTRTFSQPAQVIGCHSNKVDDSHLGPDGLYEFGVVPVDGIGNDVFERKGALLDEGLKHLGSKLRLCLELMTFGKVHLLSLLLMLGVKPGFRDKEPFVDKGITMAGGVTFKDSHLAVVHFTDGAAVLALDSDFDEFTHGSGSVFSVSQIPLLWLGLCICVSYCTQSTLGNKQQLSAD